MNPGSETFQVNLVRAQGQPWGFRLQGGKDFTIPLSIQSVNPGSIAEQSGLKAGDAVLQINNRPSDELEHEQAKQEIVASGNSVNMVLQRGVVKIWKPKVTPMAELAPQGGVQLLPSSVTDGDTYIQKTSLAADKPDALHIGSGHNRTARPFGGSFGGSAGTSGPVNAQYNTPMNLYSAENAAETYKAQSAALQADMSNLTVTDATPPPPRGPSPVTITLPADANSSQIFKRRVSPAFLTVAEADPHNPTIRSASPTFLAVKQLESSNNNNTPQSAMYQEVKDGEEIRYHGYTNPRKQSRSFQLLEQGLGLADAEAETGGAGVAAPAAGIRSVKAPVFDPSQHEIQQAQHMTCKACGTLIVGVFVRIKGEPMHPECFKCAKCGKNLKNQGYFTVEGRMYCEADAKTVSQPGAGQDMYAVPVYR